MTVFYCFQSSFSPCSTTLQKKKKDPAMVNLELCEIVKQEFDGLKWKKDDVYIINTIIIKSCIPGLSNWCLSIISMLEAEKTEQRVHELVMTVCLSCFQS